MELIKVGHGDSLFVPYSRDSMKRTSNTRPKQAALASIFEINRMHLR